MPLAPSCLVHIMRKVCVKFHPDPISTFEEKVEQIDRHTKQTNIKISHENTQENLVKSHDLDRIL